MIRIAGKASALAAVANAKGLNVIKDALTDSPLIDLTTYIKTKITNQLPKEDEFQGLRYYEIKEQEKLKDELMAFGLKQGKAEELIAKLDGRMYMQNDVCDGPHCTAREDKRHILDMDRFLTMATEKICYKFVAQDFGWAGEEEQPKLTDNDRKNLYDTLRLAYEPKDFTVKTELYFSKKTNLDTTLASYKCTESTFESAKRKILDWDKSEFKTKIGTKKEWAGMKAHMARDTKKITALEAQVAEFEKGTDKVLSASELTLAELKERFDVLKSHFAEHHKNFLHSTRLENVDYEEPEGYTELFETVGKKLADLEEKMSHLKERKPEETEEQKKLRLAQEQKEAAKKAADDKKNKWTKTQIALLAAVIVVALASIIAAIVCIRKNKADDGEDLPM